MRRHLHALALLAHCLAAAADLPLVKHGDTFVPDHVLRVSTRNVSVACEARVSAVVNGTSPGPELRVRPGLSWIRVYNEMEDANLTMHWHGLAQRMAIFSDGSPQGSQWPIPPGHFFDYALRTEAGDAGTYFYHSHVGMQALSVSGALIVDECGRPPYDYDEERTLHWSDFFPQRDGDIEAGLTSVPFRWSGETRAVLLNGQGVAVGRTAKSRADGGADGDEGRGGACSLPVIDVDPGKTYRFRFIGATGLSLVSIAFEGHANLSIVQVDGGQWTQPAAVSRIQLGSGQRFDALFVAKSKEQLGEGRQTFFVQFETLDRPERYRGYAVLRYAASALPKGAPRRPPINMTGVAAHEWLEQRLQPLDAAQTHPTLADVTRRVVIDSAQLVDPRSQRIKWRLANQSWTDDVARVPMLVDIYTRGAAAVPDYEAAVRHGGWDEGTRAFPARLGEVLEIVLQNTASRVNGAVDVHPFHAHGQHVYDVGAGPGLYDAAANEARLQATGYRAVRRDTTMLYRYAAGTQAAGAPAGWRAWRVRIEQPGVWMLHCHTLQHMVMGMQSLWVVGSADEIRRVPLEHAHGYLEYGGDAYGSHSHAPSYVHEYGDGGAYAGGACVAPKHM